MSTCTHVHPTCITKVDTNRFMARSVHELSTKQLDKRYAHMCVMCVCVCDACMCVLDDNLD